MMLGLLYKLRRADVLPAEFDNVGLMSSSVDVKGLQPMLERLDPPGLNSSEDVLSSVGLAITELGDDVVKNGGGMVYWKTPGDTC
jgi:hypothetical protein